MTVCLEIFDDAAAFLRQADEHLAQDPVLSTVVATVAHGRGEQVVAVNGALPAARVLADETARLRGGLVEVAMRTRLWELRAVQPREGPDGTLRVATEDDAELVVAWFAAFHGEADEQAGRDAGHDARGADPDLVRQRLRDGVVQLWEHRGRGYAGAAVAIVSQQILDQGARPCLFTDQDNPVSNRLYEAIGYRPVADLDELLVLAPGSRP